MHYLPKRYKKAQLFRLAEELSDINELQDFLDLKLAMTDRGYLQELEGAIALQDTAHKRAIMREWLEDNFTTPVVPLVEPFVPVNLRKREADASCNH